MPHHHAGPHPGMCEQSPSVVARLAALAALAKSLPSPTWDELLAGTEGWHQPPWAPTEIVPGLHQGGTEDHDVLSRPGQDYRRRGNYPFDTVITLYASAQPVPWGVEELRYGFPDGTLHDTDLDTVVHAARFAHGRWLDGAHVLIRCQAGMNRSGLVTALVLVLAGLAPAQAINQIRMRRGPSCLFNTDFVTWLVDSAATVLFPERQQGQPHAATPSARDTSSDLRCRPRRR